MTEEIAGAFRQAMRRLAATVNLISLTENGTPMGMAATAVCSVSMDPPSLLVCVNKSASLHPSLVAATHFSVNVLHKDQIETARLFSDNSLRDMRFADAGWQQHPLGPPLLANAQVGLICQRSEMLAFATHTIVIGSVVDVAVRIDINPLLYLDGAFEALRD